MIPITAIVLTAAILVLLGVFIGRAWTRRCWDDELDDAYDEGYQRCERDAEARERAQAELAEETGPATEQMGWMTAPDEWDDQSLSFLHDAGPETLTEMERVAAITDHYAADPGRRHALQAAEIIRDSALIQDWIDGWKDEIMPAGDAFYEQAMTEMAADLERLGAG